MTRGRPQEALRWAYHRFVKPRLVRRYLATAKPALNIEFHGAGIGMFAQFVACVQVFRHAEARGLTPHVRLTSHNYLDPSRGGDWFDYYFDRPGSGGPPPNRSLRIGNIAELPWFDQDLPLRELRDIFFKYMRVKPEIMADVDAFCQAHGVGSGTIGVHYRGTDKSTEAAIPEYEAVYSIIGRVLAGRPGTANVFVASDEAAFVAGMAGRFPGVAAIAYEDSVRSRDGRPVHLNDIAPGNYQMGRDALVNSLILSRCGAVIRSTSFLSMWASVFNPDLPVILVNLPYGHKMWYPETEIIKTATLARDLPGPA